MNQGVRKSFLKALMFELGVNCMREGKKGHIRANSKCKGMEAETAWHVIGTIRNSMWLEQRVHV